MSIKLSKSESAVDVNGVAVPQGQISTGLTDAFKQFFYDT